MAQRHEYYVPAGLSARSSNLSRYVRSRERALAFILSRGIADKQTADGVPIGIQATLATGGGPFDGLELDTLLDAMVASDRPNPAEVFADDPMRDSWRAILSMMEEKLGFPLEPELFSNMLFAAHLGRDERSDVAALANHLVSTFRDREADGLHHFFASMRFACDVDCTAMAARARLATGDVDPSTPEGAAALGRITGAILRSAAVRDVPAEQNLTHGKVNGPLRRHVFKVYLDDHAVQGPECDRGLKNNPVVVANALFPVLFELKCGLRDAGEEIRLKEFVVGSDAPRTGVARVADIVSANVRYASGYLFSGDWRRGCRYYPSPDAFLCFYAENVREFPELFAAFQAARAVREAIEERRRAERSEPATDPEASLNTAFRAIAATSVGMDPSPELDRLVERQTDSGAWTDPDCFYSFGSSTAIPIHFRSNVLTTGFAARALAMDGEPWAEPARADWANPIIERVVREIL
jgi:hypothetical protein